MAKTVEEILRALEADDEPANGEETETPDAPENTTLKAVRDWGKGWEKKAKSFEKKVEDLEKFRTEVVERERKTVVTGVFKELGLPEKQADLFLKTNDGEVTADAVKQFVTDFGLVPGGEEEGQEKVEEKRGFEPGGVSPQGGTPKPVLVTTAELMELLKTDPAQASKLVEEGKVERPSWDDLYKKPTKAE